MKGLSIVGTIAMFMVGGGILTHGIPGAHERIERIAHGAGSTPGIGIMLEMLLPTLLDIVAGIVAGALVLLGVTLAARWLRPFKRSA
jgi:predicted DNA repair protein MutK